MKRVLFLAPVLAGAILLVSGCATSRDRGAGAVNELIQARGAPAAKGLGPPVTPATASTPIGVRQAVELAFERSPRVRELYAELGLSTADVIAARAIPQLTLGYARLAGGGGTKVTRSASLGFTDLLLMPARARFAGANYEIARERTAAQLLALEGDVEAAWYDYVAALQAAEYAEVAARAAEASAEYARRLDAAGNLPPRTLALELASAAESRIGAARAHAAAQRARASLAALAGLSTRDEWSVPMQLPAPPADIEAQEDVTTRALDQRLDLAAARREVAAFESALTATKVWRWFGDFEVGYERETETDGVRLHGPTLALKLPLFNFNRDGVLRAESALESAQARRDALELSVRNDVALSLDRLATAHDIAETYRTALVPQREAATARTLESVNYMLSGAFELLATRREQYAAYREYTEAVRDYWLARVELRRAIGGAP